MQHRPGMYAQMTLEQEARRHGVRVLVPDVNASGLRFDLEKRTVRMGHSKTSDLRERHLGITRQRRHT